MRFGKSLKSRLSMSYLIIIIVTLIITDIALVSILRAYFNNNVRDTVLNQLIVATDTYERYYSDSSLERNVASDEDAFWRQSGAMVQIISLDGIVLLDSSGNRPEEALETQDVILALEGSRGSIIYLEPVTGEKLMAVSSPLTANGEIVGILRFITSLRSVDDSMRVIVTSLVIFGVAVLLLSFIISNILALRFIRPIDKLTKTAEIMATGNYNVVSVKMHEDEIGKLSDTLNYMASEIKKKEALKNDFISSVSHELRTPLTAIKGWALTIKDPSTDRALLLQGLDIISEESDRLKGMVDELLDFSKFVSGKITLEKEAVEIRGLFEFISSHMNNRAEREHKTLDIRTEKDMGTVYADLNRLKQVFINLLDNSFKFTEEGGTISLSMRRTKDSVYFTVEDDGEGILPEDISKVKEKFYKGKTSNSTNGIGLSVCDEIAISHGGELIIESELNRGTKITIRIPQGGVS